MEHLGPGWVWCLHCERVYRRDEVRWDSENEVYLCAYEDYDGDTPCLMRCVMKNGGRSAGGRKCRKRGLFIRSISEGAE